MMKSIGIFLFLYTFSLFANFEIIPDTCTLHIESPDLSEQKIRKLRLDNGLEALLISDPQTHQSGAALAVETGSWDDPSDRPGMAHFVEHMLFLGTKKYPEEEGYTRYLDEHGGTRNAFTMADRTVYMFSVNNNAFSEALDRFGQFFIAPLFNPSGVDRESKAIHQEYCQDLPLDPWRMLFVQKERANKKHPFHDFSIGNAQTLTKISQDELKTWYHAHYSSNLMHLVVYSPLDLDRLEQEVVTIFSEVKNLNKERSSYSELLFEYPLQPELCAIAPMQDMQLLQLSWEIPRFYGRDHHVHADKLLSHVLGHEGATSLLAQLKREHLAESLGAGTFHAGHDQSLLTLSIQLTSKGIQEYETVIQRCYEALASLKQSGIPLYLFDEVCQIKELQYRFQSRQEIFHFVSEYAMGMVDEPLDSFPQLGLIPSVYDPEKITSLLASLTPDRCLYTLVADPKLIHRTPTIKEKWLGVDYTLIPIPNTKIAKWTQLAAHPSICIPRPNPFLPENLKVHHQPMGITSLLPTPTLITDEPLGKIYAAADTQFLIPEVTWHFTFKTPEISDADPLSHVFADLYCHTVAEQLNTTSYEAMMGGLIYSLQPKHGALELSIKGYSDKAGTFLATIIQTMLQAVPTKKQFDLYYELLARDYINTLNLNPLKQGGDVLWSILYKDFPSLRDKSSALQTASYEQMCSFCRHLLSRCYVEGMLFGNQSQEEALAVWDIFKEKLHASPYLKTSHPKLELATLPSEHQPAFLVIPSQLPANGLILTTDCGAFSFKRRAAQEILTKGLEEPFFSELRTKQQTAYVVANWSQELERHLYSFFAIQSSSHDTRDLLARFELFLESSMQHLQESVIPEERFTAIKQAYIHKLSHPADNLSSMGSLLHKLAFQYDGEFDWFEKRIKAFEELSYPEFVAYAQEYLGKENPRRLAICVNGALPNHDAIYRQVVSPEGLRQEISYSNRIMNLQEQEELSFDTPGRQDSF